MSRALIVNSFISGEIDRAFYSRTDLQKYGQGVALARNFTIDFRGGLKSRPGFLRKAALAGNARLFSFSLGEGAHPIVAVFYEEQLRLWDGEEFLEDEFATPYGPVCLTQLQAHFWLNSLVITCNNWPPHELVFEDGAFVWRALSTANAGAFPATMSLETFRVSGTGANREIISSTGNANVVFAVSAVDVDGNESVAGRIQLFTSAFNYATEAGLGRLTWAEVAGAVEYKIYRSIITEGDLDISAGLGLLATSKTRVFTDNNFAPDFSQPPRQPFDPFANGAVLEVEITDAGSGFTTTAPALSIATADGTGLIARPVIGEGELRSILILFGGSGYLKDEVITVTNPDGPDGTAKITAVSPPTGNNPAASTIAQSRRFFAGTKNLPLTFNASRVGKLRDFSSGEPPAPDDGFSFSIDAEDISPIKHLIRVRNGVMVMHARGVDRVIGSEGKSIGPTSREVENQADIGVGGAAPVTINDDIIFATRWGSSIISMAFTFYTNSYAPQEVSVLAPHLLGFGKAPIRFAWMAEPDKLLWVLREDGVLLSLTYMKEQEIFAWAQHTTQGTIRDILAVNAAGRQILYAVVERPWGWQLETLAPREFTSVEDYVGADSALIITSETATNTITGLGIFNGRSVSVLADGDALLEVPVEDGEATLSFEAKKFIVGLPYECLAQTLPLSDPEQIREGLRGRLVGLALRLEETRGLEIGSDLRAVYEMKDRGYEDWGAPIELRSDYSYVPLAANWTRDSQILFRQTYPLPAHILGFVADVEVEK